MDIARNVDWYILPLANPDGFKYSHDHVSSKAIVIFHLHKNILFHFFERTVCGDQLDLKITQVNLPWTCGNLVES